MITTCTHAHAHTPPRRQITNVRAGCGAGARATRTHLTIYTISARHATCQAQAPGQSPGPRSAAHPRPRLARAGPTRDARTADIRRDAREVGGQSRRQRSGSHLQSQPSTINVVIHDPRAKEQRIIGHGTPEQPPSTRRVRPLTSDVNDIACRVALGCRRFFQLPPSLPEEDSMLHIARKLASLHPVPRGVPGRPSEWRRLSPRQRPRPSCSPSVRSTLWYRGSPRSP